MTTATKLREQVAYRLGILGEGESLRAYQTADLDEAYAEVYAQLDVRDMATWDTDEEVPDEYAPHVVSLVAASRADAYGIPNDRYQRIMMAESKALGDIKELQTSNTYETPESDYF